MKVDWRGRADFAEIAEAVGVETEFVMMYSPEHRIVLWSEGDDVYGAEVERDADGIFVAGPKHHRFTLTEMKAQIDKELGL